MSRRGRATLWLALLTAALGPWLDGATAADEVAVDLEVIGRTDLGGGGPFDDVTIVGTTAMVASGECPRGAVTLVSLKDPRKPSVVATLPMAAGTVAADIDGATVATPSFTGDLMAVALRACSPGAAVRAQYFDVTDPARSRLLAEGPACAGCPAQTAPVTVAQREDGRVLSVTAVGPVTVAVVEVTDPARPVTLSRWAPSEPAPAGSCIRPQVTGVDLYQDGRRALVLFADGRVHDLSLFEPAQPGDGGEPVTPERATQSRYAALLPIGTRTLLLVSAEGPDGACPGADAPGLRVLEVGQGGLRREVEPVRFTTAAVPGRLVASGELAYVAWHGDGLRVVDMGQVRARAVAQFIPERAAVVGVDLLDDHVVVVDRNSGMYVLERPDEGGARHSFWSELVGLLPYLGFAGFMAAVFVVPRLAMARAAQRSGVPSPVPERAGRRPA